MYVGRIYGVVNLRRGVQAILRREVETAVANVTNFERVVIPEGMLNAESPINRLRILLIYRHESRSIEGRCPHWVGKR